MDDSTRSGARQGPAPAGSPEDEARGQTAARAEASRWGRKLKLWRLPATQQEVADLAEISSSYLCLLEKGQRVANAELRHRLEKAAKAAGAVARRKAAEVAVEEARLRADDAEQDHAAAQAARSLTQDGHGGAQQVDIHSQSSVVYGPSGSVVLGIDVRFWDLLEATLARIVRRELAAWGNGGGNGGQSGKE